ncbi:MAG: effector-associated domain EAD1-containing protein [Sphaerospermopsis sp.]|nr:effector-associated domain EAD1-containing protein [Sphaerospermopsis sp.]
MSELLTGEERGKLEAAIIDAYNNMSLLKIQFDGNNFFSEKKHQDNIQWNTGEANNLFVNKLVDWVIKFEKVGIKNLIEAARKGNPDNEKLKSIQEKLFPNIYEKPINPASKHWDSLRDILDNIGLDVLEKVCRMILENDPKNKDINGNYPELNNLKKVATLKEIILDKYPQNTLGKPTIIEFAQRLTQEEGINNNIIQQLKNWIQKVGNQLNIEAPYYQYTPQDSSTNAQPYLMIVAYPKGDDKFNLKAELIINFINFNHEINKQKTIKIDTPQQVVLPCIWDNIAQNIYEYILVAQAKITETYHEYDLTVELFLPINYLHKNIDAQELRNRVNKNEAISKSYRFTLRSLERFNSGDNNYINKLRKRWVKVNDYFKIICESDKCNWEKLALEWENNQQILVIFTCCLPNDEEQRNDLFISMITTGLPISLWTRKDQLPNLDIKEEYEKDILLKIDKNNFESSLIELVWKKRKQAHVETKGERQNHLGYHLGFLCDNPYRIPFCLQDNNQQLIEPGN